MSYVFVVYRESTAQNFAAFTTYELAERYIDMLIKSNSMDEHDYYIDKLQLLSV